MGLRQELGRIETNTPKGLQEEVNQLDQNSYIFPPRADEYHYSYMGSAQKIEFNKYASLLKDLEQIQF